MNWPISKSEYTSLKKREKFLFSRFSITYAHNSNDNIERYIFEEEYEKWY